MGEASREFKKGVSDGAKAEPAELAPERDEKVTMSKAEYDALLAERDAKARKDAPPAV
jgi:Sec-independent protein translocase protein TatA